MIDLLTQVLRGPFSVLLPFVSLTVAAAIWCFCQLFFMPLNIIYLQVFYEDCVKEKGWEWQAKPWRLSGYKLLALFGLAIVIGIPSFGGLKLLERAAKSEVRVPTAPFVNPLVGSPATTASSATSAETAALPAATPTERDLIRYERLSVLKIALSDYESENYSFPSTLNLLMPKHLMQLPSDPQSETTFAYVGALEDYKVVFQLEAGVFALSRGEHVMTSKGFDLPADLSKAPRPKVVPMPTAPATVTTAEPTEELPPTDIFAPADVFDSVPTTTPADETTASAPSADEQIASAPEPAAPEKPAVPDDTDGDILSDALELKLGTDPLKMDTDLDTLSDAEEALVYGTDPLLTDTDDDGFDDDKELISGYNPHGSSKLTKAELATIAALRAKLVQASQDGLIIDAQKL
jgi:hypothetical protein